MCIGYTKGAIYMKKSISKILLGLGIVVALCGGASYRVEARVTSVKATKKSGDKIKVTFKYDSKAKKKGIKKYKVRLTKYTYSKNSKKWVAGKKYYKTVSAYNSKKKLKTSLSTTFSNKPINNVTAYKVQVLSANKYGTAKTSYTTAQTVGCMHDYLWKSETHQELVSEAVTKKVEEFKCDGCGYTDTAGNVNKHLVKYVSDMSDEYETMTKAFCKEKGIIVNTTSEIDAACNELVSKDDTRLEYYNYIITYLNNKYGYTTRLYTKDTLPRVGGEFACRGSNFTGNYIETIVTPAKYKDVTTLKATCRKCGAELE